MKVVFFKERFSDNGAIPNFYCLLSKRDRWTITELCHDRGLWPQEFLQEVLNEALRKEIDSHIHLLEDVKI